MKPIQTLIVDDEIFVAESLRALVDWNSLGFEIVQVCHNARQALEVIRTCPVDLILCDIKMPEMNGIELISQVRREFPQIESIIISGYSDFAYAQSAIRYGATAYCLKPFDEDETINALELARRKILHNRKKNEYIMAELLFPSDGVPAERIREDLTALGFQLKQPIYICVLLGGTCDFSSTALSFHLLAGSEEYIYLLQPRNSYRAMVQQLREACARQNASAGLDCVGSGLKLSRHIERARQCAMAGFITEKRELICCEEVRPRQQQRSQSLAALLPQPGMSSVKKAQYIEDTCALFAKEQYSVRDAYHFYHLLISQCLATGHKEIYDCDGYEAMVEEFKSLREMLRQIVLQDEGEIPSCTDSHGWIQKIMDYCDTYYAEPISITIASNMLHISPSYFSTLFKKETGENFTAYVTRLRLEKASSLLLTTKKNVSDIAIEVGYSDYYYFTKVFRKHFGVTPTEYRQSAT